MQSYNYVIPGCTVSRLLNRRQARNTKYAGKPRVLTINTLAALAATFIAVVFCCLMQSHRQSQFCANLIYHESDPG